MAQRVEVAVLGPVAVRVDGALVPLPSVPQRVVLARLALSGDRLASAAALVDALWPDDPPRNATGNLQAYVSRLRQVVGADRIGREPGGYRLRGVDEVDLDRAEALVAGARRAAAAGDPAAAATGFGAALDLWRGEPLADLPDPAPFAPDLARLAAWRRQIELDWLAARLAAGEDGRVLPDLERAVAADPLREDVHVLLASALHRVGRTADALQVVAGYRRRLADEHGLDPSPALTGLTATLLADDPAPGTPAPRAPAAPAGRGYAPGDRFVGRGDELAATRAALDAHRLVTVVGPGGVGKTRLALELADRLPTDRAVTLVELHLVSRSEDVPAAVATAFGLQATRRAATPGSTLGQEVADLVGDKPVVLLLDNCEHVRPAAAELVGVLLRRCPALRVVATSRQRLALPGEKVLRLGPLPADDQVELFCDRAALLRDDFAATDDVRAVAGEICRAIDGLPLAVELAASREAVFGLAQLRDRLAAGLQVLEPVRDPDRSSAVTATVEWSYRLLDPTARELFDRLSVCQGFPLAAVGHFTRAGGPEALLAELVEASLVVPVPAAGGPPRYRLLETMRLVGLSHLDDAELRAAYDMHAGWMAAHVARTHALRCAGSPDSVTEFLADMVNVREAIARLVDSGQWARAGEIGVLLAYAVLDQPDLGMLAQLERLAAVPEGLDATARARCATAAGAAAWLQGDTEAALRLLDTAVDGLPADDPQHWIGRYFALVAHMFGGLSAAVHADTDALLADPTTPERAVGSAVCCSVLTHLFAGEREAAVRRLAAHADLVERVSAYEGFVEYTHGELAAETDPERALEYFSASRRLSDAQGRRYTSELAAVGRSAVLIRLGRRREAAVSCRDALQSLRTSGMWPQLWVMLRLTAELLVDLGDHRAAAVLLAAGERDPFAPAVLEPEQRRHAALWSAIADRLGPDGVAAARAQAVRVGRAAALDLALSALPPP